MNHNSIVAVFSGQGSQHVGMAKDLYENFKVAREVFEEACDAAHINLRRLCFEGPEKELVLTENTQPCLLATSVAAFRVAESELGFRPAVTAGHSLGEYSALVAAGALPLGSAVYWVQQRGAAMQRAVPAGQGTMAAIIGLEDQTVTELCATATQIAQEKRARGERSELSVEPIVEPANYNAPGQTVISGSLDGIDEAFVLLRSDSRFTGGKAMPLSVSAPFHSRLMAPARARVGELLAEAKPPKSLTFPYVPNRTARLTQEPGLVYEFLVEQVDLPVLWKQSIENLLNEGYESFVEFGPGKVLQGLVKRIAQKAGKTCALTGIADSASLRAAETLITGKAPQ